MTIETNLYLAIISRVAVLGLLSVYLLRRWYASEKRFFSDFPFLIGISMAILAAAKLYDLWIYDYLGTQNIEVMTEQDPVYLIIGKIRYLLIIGNILPLFTIMLLIWFRENTKVRISSVVIFVAFWIFYILLAPNYTYLKNALLYMLLPLCLLSVITYFFLYKNKRLPEIHSLIIGIAWIAYIFSSLVRPILMEMGSPPWGLTWIAEVIDLVIWAVMTIGYVVKPPYYFKQKEIT